MKGINFDALVQVAGMQFDSCGGPFDAPEPERLTKSLRELEEIG